MSSAVNYPHISIDENGTARIGQTRYKVIHLAAKHYHYGCSAEELMRQHPDLRPEEVYAALTYFYDHYDTLLSQMKADTEPPPSFPQLAVPRPLHREIPKASA